VSDDVTSRFRTGRNQQAILRCLADGRARTNSEIADAIGVRRSTVSTTTPELVKREWLADTGERGYYKCKKWTITPQGHAVISQTQKTTA
jgi:DNA-binding IclR family transcriptional regulator